MKGVLILGASSSIARAAAKGFAEKGYPLYLAGRDLLDLERIALDLKVRYPIQVKWGYFSAENHEDHPAFVKQVVDEMGGLDGVLLAFGSMEEVKKAALDFTYAKKIIEINFTGACSVLTDISNYLGKEGKGFIIAISSVAGDRGRQSNYVYGASKAGLSAFLEGLRNRMFHFGVRVITIKPGLVDTAMTFGLPRMIFLADPEEVGRKIVKTLDKKGDVVYLPWFWRFIMGIVRTIPESLFKKLKL